MYQTYTLTGQVRLQYNDGFTSANTYDELGRLVRVSETGNVIKEYSYDLRGNRTAFTLEVSGNTELNTTYDYDELSRLTSVKENGVTEASYTYDINGNRATMFYANGVITEYSYNLANMVTSLVSKDSYGAILTSYANTYYLDGNQRTKTDHNGRTTLYIYDGLGRLKSEIESGAPDAKSYAYTFDARNNRESLTVGGAEVYTIVYSYDLNNRLLESSKAIDDHEEVTTYQYDLNGNTISQITSYLTPSNIEPSYLVLGGSGWELSEYNGLNHLVRTIKDGVVIEYAYKPDGMRLSKTVDGERTTHVWDGMNIVLERGNNGNVIDSYLRGIGLIRNSQAEWFHFNWRGDVVQLTGVSGNIIREYDYDAFGVERDPDSEDANPWRYCGEYFDAETGTYYLRARYYSPVNGRFTQEDPFWNVNNMIYGNEPIKWNERSIDENDPLGLSTYTYKPNIHAITQSSNLYLYCGNNPIMFVDPSGEFWHILAGAVAGAVVGTIASMITQVATTGRINLTTTIVAAGSGAISGGLAASGVGLGIQVVANGAIGAIAGGTESFIRTGSIDPLSVATGLAAGMLGGALGGAGVNSNNYLSSLSRQFSTRVANALTHQSGDALIRELGNAIIHFGKSASTTAIQGFESIIRSYIPAVAIGGVVALNNLIRFVMSEVNN
jgi:RHS repeat-associated protein